MRGILFLALIFSCALAGADTALDRLPGDAGIGGGDDSSPDLTTDGAGNWVAVWESQDSLGGALGTEADILVASSTDNGATWTYPTPLNANAGFDSGWDFFSQVSTDGSGIWLVVWCSNESLGGTIGTDADVLVARSTNNGLSWSPPEPLNGNAVADTSDDLYPHVTTDGAGGWVAVWSSYDSLGGTIGADVDVLVARSTDAGETWSHPEPLNGNAATDSGDDWLVRVTTDGSGHWVAAWQSDDSLEGTIGTDRDIFMARSADDGQSWSYPEPLNGNAATDSGDDHVPQLATDGSGNWVAVWDSEDDLGAVTIGTDYDIFVARSTNNGQAWTYPEALTDAADNVRDDNFPQIATDASGNWLAVWMFQNEYGILWDWDIFSAHSTDNGVTWTDPEPLNTHAGMDHGLQDGRPRIATDGLGNWLSVWESGLPLSGVDWEVLLSRSQDNGATWTDPSHLKQTNAYHCGKSAQRHLYGMLLFPRLCTRDAIQLPGMPGEPFVYRAAEVRLRPGPNDGFYLSSSAMGPLAVDEAVLVNGLNVGLGPYEYQPGVPPFVLDVPIEENLVPLPAHDITDLIPAEESWVRVELVDTQREVFGNTRVTLTRDCGIWVDPRPSGSLELNWVSYEVEVGGVPGDLEVVTGAISELLEDGDFSRACLFGTFPSTTQVIDSRPDPPPGGGYYYLVSGTCARPIGYGNSSGGPRGDLGTSPPCP